MSVLLITTLVIVGIIILVFTAFFYFRWGMNNRNDNEIKEFKQIQDETEIKQKIPIVISRILNAKDEKTKREWVNVQLVLELKLLTLDALVSKMKQTNLNSREHVIMLEEFNNRVKQGEKSINPYVTLKNPAGRYKM